MHINQESMNSATIGRITTRDRVSRGERILHQLVDKHALSQEGYEAVIAAVDPMHDRPIKDLQGWPDLESTPSVVRCIKKICHHRNVRRWFGVRYAYCSMAHGVP